ncbi:unnamed protein product [Caretta caretta]
MYVSFHPSITVTFLIDADPSKTCKMLLLHVVILALVLSYGCAQIRLRQARLSVTRAEKKTARIVCEASGIQNFRSAVIHWYRHRPGEAPERILYISPEKVQFDKDSDKKFDVFKQELGAIFIIMEEGVIYAGARAISGDMVGFLEILFACLLPSVLWAIRLEQVPISIIKKPHEDTIAEFTCKLSDTLESTNIHWYSKLRRLGGMSGSPLCLRLPCCSVGPSPGAGADLSHKAATSRQLCDIHLQDGSSQVRLTQPQLSITREGNKAIRIDCRVSLSEDFGKAPIHWYRQRPGAAPEWILFISMQSVLNGDSDKGKFNAEKKIGQSTYGAAQVQLTQVQLSITRKTMKTVRIDCKVSGISFGDAYMHWYRQRPGEAPEWILYFKSQADKSNFDNNKFSVDKATEKSTCTLTVDKLTYNDMATYYCAYWDYTVSESHRQAVQKPHSVF